MLKFTCLGPCIRSCFLIDHNILKGVFCSTAIGVVSGFPEGSRMAGLGGARSRWIHADRLLEKWGSGRWPHWSSECFSNSPEGPTWANPLSKFLEISAWNNPCSPSGYTSSDRCGMFLDHVTIYPPFISIYSVGKTGINAIPSRKTMIKGGLWHDFTILDPCRSFFPRGHSQMKVSWNRSTPSHHPFVDGIFSHKPSSYWVTPSVMPRCPSFSTPGGEPRGWLTEQALRALPKPLLAGRGSGWSPKQKRLKHEFILVNNGWYCLIISAPKKLKPSTSPNRKNTVMYFYCLLFCFVLGCP